MNLFTSKFSLKIQHGSNQVHCVIKNEITLFNSYFSRQTQRGSNKVVYFEILSKITLRYSVLKLLVRDNLIQTK